MKVKGATYRVLPVERMHAGDRIRVSGRTIESVQVLGSVTSPEAVSLTYVGGGAGVFHAGQRFGIDRPSYDLETFPARVEQRQMDGIAPDLYQVFDRLLDEARMQEHGALRMAVTRGAGTTWSAGWASGYQTAARAAARHLRRLAAAVCPDRSPFQERDA